MVKRRNAAAEMSEGEGSTSESDAAASRSDEECSEDVVDVDFEFFDPKPDDFHGAKALLRTYLDDAEWDLSGFVDLILSQTTVGTVVKAGADESPIGLITVLNMRRHKEVPSVQAVRKFLHKHGKEKPEISKLDELWESSDNIGLLVSERVVNVPLQLCAPLHDSLFDEIAWATEDEPSDVLRDSYKFKQYLILTRVYQEVIPPPSSSSSSKAKKKNKKSQQGGDASLIFIKPEDEIFLQLSSWHLTFPVQSEAMRTHETKGLKLLRLLMLVSAQQIDVFKSKLKELIQNP